MQLQTVSFKTLGQTGNWSAGLYQGTTYAKYKNNLDVLTDLVLKELSEILPLQERIILSNIPSGDVSRTVYSSALRTLTDKEFPAKTTFQERLQIAIILMEAMSYLDTPNNIKALTKRREALLKELKDIEKVLERY